MESPALLAAVFDAIRDPILVVDEAGEVQAANAAAMRLFDLEHAGDGGARISWDRLAVDPRQLFDLVSGGERARGVPVVDRAGRDTGIRVDVEPLSAERRYRVLHFRACADAVRRELWTDEAVASVAHELRNPLWSMQNALDVMASGAAGELSEPQRRFIDAVRRGTRRLSRMAEGYLDLSRARAGALSLARDSQDVRALVNELSADLVTLHPLLAGRLVADVAPDVDLAFIDRDRIAQVLLNLVANAVRFTPAGRRVTVRASRAGREVLADELRLLPWNEIGEPDWVRIDVEDEGIGMAADTLARVFDPYREPDDAANAAGAGAHLGLHIARTLVEAHDGWMTVESRLGEGTTVSVFVPGNEETARRVSRVRAAATLVDRLRAARRPATLAVIAVADWTSLRDADRAWTRVAVVNPGAPDLQAGRPCAWVLSDRLAVAVLPGRLGAEDAALMFSTIAAPSDDERAACALLTAGACAVDDGASFAQVLGRAIARMTNPTPPLPPEAEDAPVPVTARAVRAGWNEKE